MGRRKRSESKQKKQSKLTTENATDTHLDLKNDNKNQKKFYRIQKSEVLGRHLTASKNIKPGETILVDEPIVVGPCQESQPLCIGCYVNIELSNSQDYFRCSFCSWPLCSSNCSGLHTDNGHSKGECELWSKSFVKDKECKNFTKFFYAVTPFRCLLLKEKNPQKWEIINGMEAHTEERKKDAKLWETNETLAVHVIRNVWGFSHFSAEEIHFACGVLEINCFEVNLHTQGTQSLRALYPTAFLFAHDCTPNTYHSNGNKFEIIFRATTLIPKNSIISVSYAYTLQSTLMRRKHIQKTKFFFCNCKRCSDSTEFGTYVGAVKCLMCKTGFLLPEHSLDNDSVWRCNLLQCGSQVEVSQVVSLSERFFSELERINRNDIIGYEKFLEKCEKIFHKNHYLCLSAKHDLCQLYGKTDGYLINNLSQVQLLRKVEICKHLITIYDKIYPGISKLRGTLLYELHAPLMVLLRRDFENQKISKREVNAKLTEIVNYLNEAHLILSKEPENSIENQMACAAKEALSNLKC